MDVGSPSRTSSGAGSLAELPAGGAGARPAEAHTQAQKVAGRLRFNGDFHGYYHARSHDRPVRVGVRVGPSTRRRTTMLMSAAVLERPAPPVIDLAAVKARQQGAWSSGDYAIIGTTLQIVGEQLCEALDLRAGQTVLDVAAGNGNASLAAARRWCDVVATDYVPALLERASERAEAERLDISFQEADAEALPFHNGSFDVVVSTFGVMFTPNQERAAAEMIRVCRRGGKIGL